MNGLLPAVATAVFVWWFSTGLVLILVRLSRRAIRLSVALATGVGVAALYGLSHTARQTGLAGAYCAFTCALLAWAWHELTFLSGWITGPRRTALPAGLSGWPRFVQSLRAILWHEIGILVVGLIIVAITWRQPNQVGTGTFLVLWVMRTSAKLNLFLGVRNLSEQFLPEHLAYLQSFFRRRRMNGFFPVALSLSMLALVALVMVALQPSTPAATSVGHALVGTMLALAIVEHALLVLPVDTAALWRWALRFSGGASDAAPSPDRALPGQADAVRADETLVHAR